MPSFCSALSMTLDNELTRTWVMYVSVGDAHRDPLTKYSKIVVIEHPSSGKDETLAVTHSKQLEAVSRSARRTSQMLCKQLHPAPS
jgi:hypothetical protein